jgi:hypothetical protein
MYGEKLHTHMHMHMHAYVRYIHTHTQRERERERETHLKPDRVVQQCCVVVIQQRLEFLGHGPSIVEVRATAS